MDKPEPDNMQQVETDFVKSHCRQCVDGQTITRPDTAAHAGGKGTYCLSLREWMTNAAGTALISHCDRYEQREQDAAD